MKPKIDVIKSKPKLKVLDDVDRSDYTIHPIPNSHANPDCWKGW